MRIINEAIASAVDLSVDASSAAFPVPAGLCIAIQVVIAGASPTGTLSVQGSCDPGADTLPPQPTPTNWTDLVTPTSVSAAGTIIYELKDTGVPWVRLHWVASMGSVGTASARLNSKGF